MLREDVDDLAARGLYRLHGLLVAGEPDPPMRIIFRRAGNDVLVAEPPRDTADDLASVALIGAAGLEADTVLTIFTAYMVPVDDDQRAANGELVTAGDIARLVDEGGLRTGLVKEALITIGSNRAGDVEVALDMFTRHDGTVTWETGPPGNVHQIAEGQLGSSLRDAMLAPTTVQHSMASNSFDMSEIPTERSDCLVAQLLTIHRHCSVHLVAAAGDVRRRRQLKYWGEHDWGVDTDKDVHGGDEPMS